MKQQIQQLIAEGRTEEALALLAQQSSDALLLQARYNNGKKQYNMGLIEFSEWQRTQAQINYAALELSNSVKSGGAATAGTPATGAHPAATPAPQVFISYNRKDSAEMHNVKNALELQGIKVIVDVKDVGAGEDIQGFIDKAIKENHFILSLVSRNSLVSGWVNKEISAALLLNRMSNKWIPVCLDKDWNDPDFYEKAMGTIDGEINGLKAKMKKALEDDHDTGPFEDDLRRQRELKVNLGPTLQALKKVNVVDIAGASFAGGVQKVVATIQQNS